MVLAEEDDRLARDVANALKTTKPGECVVLGEAGREITVLGLNGSAIAIAGDVRGGLPPNWFAAASRCGIEWRFGKIFRERAKSRLRLNSRDAIAFFSRGDVVVTASPRTGSWWIKLAELVIPELDASVARGASVRLLREDPLRLGLEDILLGAVIIDGRVFSPINVPRKIAGYVVTTEGHDSWMITDDAVGELIGADEILRESLEEAGVEPPAESPLEAASGAIFLSSHAFPPHAIAREAPHREITLLRWEDETIILTTATLPYAEAGSFSLKFQDRVGRLRDAIEAKMSFGAEPGSRHMQRTSIRVERLTPREVIGGKVRITYVSRPLTSDPTERPYYRGLLEARADSGERMSFPLAFSFAAAASRRADHVLIIDREERWGRERNVVLAAILISRDGVYVDWYDPDRGAPKVSVVGRGHAVYSNRRGLEALLVQGEVRHSLAPVEFVSSTSLWRLHIADWALLAIAAAQSVFVGRDAVLSLGRLGETYVTAALWRDGQAVEIACAASEDPVMAIYWLAKEAAPLIDVAALVPSSAMFEEDPLRIAVELAAALGSLI